MMKKLILGGILTALILTINDCLAQTPVTDNHTDELSDLEILKAYTVVRFTMSVNGKISNIHIDKGDGMGFMNISKFNGFPRQKPIKTEAELLNYMVDFDYQLAKTTVLSGKNSLFQFSVFEKLDVSIY